MLERAPSGKLPACPGDVPDTIQVLVEYDNGVAFNYECTLANSFEAEYDVLYGTDAAVMARGQKAWMFKEVDAPLLGWEVYARKDIFFNDTGIALMADASKQKALTAKATEATPYTETPLAFALKNFLFNVNEVSNGVEDFSATFDVNDTKALVKFLSEIKKQPAASLEDGYVATVLALKANEAVMKNGRVELSKELLTIPG